MNTASPKRTNATNRDRSRRAAFEQGKALRYYVRGAAKMLMNPTKEDAGKVAPRKSLRA